MCGRAHLHKRMGQHKGQKLINRRDAFAASQRTPPRHFTAASPRSFTVFREADIYTYIFLYI